MKIGPLDKVLVLFDSAPDRGIPIQLFLEKREFSLADAGLFTSPAEFANFNAKHDLRALRSEVSFAGFRQSMWP